LAEVIYPPVTVIVTYVSSSNNTPSSTVDLTAGSLLHIALAVVALIWPPEMVMNPFLTFSIAAPVPSFTSTVPPEMSSGPVRWFLIAVPFSFNASTWLSPEIFILPVVSL